MRLVRAGAFARVEVEDNGEGIQANALTKAFDPFYTTRLNDGGTGLGLSVAHGIITDHGGTLDINTRTGEGTIVSFQLAVHDPNACAALLQQPASRR